MNTPPKADHDQVKLSVSLTLLDNDGMTEEHCITLYKDDIQPQTCLASFRLMVIEVMNAFAKADSSQLDITDPNYQRWTEDERCRENPIPQDTKQPD